MRILVTGGAGFIGSHLVDKLVKSQHQVMVLDDMSTGKRFNVNSRCELVVGDIRDPSVVEACVADQEIIFHLAAYTSVAGSIDCPATCTDINEIGTGVLISKAVESGVKKIIFSSTSAVYPDSMTSPIPETCPAEPKSPYAKSKLEGEYLLQRYQESDGLDWVVLRYFNVYGPRQDTDSEYSAVIPAFLTSNQNGQPLTVFGDGFQTRDFVYVRDVVDANILAMENNKGGIFNVATGMPISIVDLAKLIISLEKSGNRYICCEPRQGDVASSTGDISAIKLHLNWVPQWDLLRGLTATSEWLRYKEEP